MQDQPMNPAGRSLVLVAALAAPAWLVACSSSSSNDGGNEGGSAGDASGGQGGDAASSGGHTGKGGDGGKGGAGTGGASTGGAGGNTGGGGQGGKASGGAGGVASGGTAGNAAGAGGAAGAANTGGTPAPMGTLYASEDFNATANVDAQDLTTTSGVGWDSPWQIGEHTGAKYSSIADAKPLTYLDLKTSGNYLTHQRWDVGRRFDVTKGLKDFVTDGLVSKAGSTFWLSALVRIDAMKGKEPVFITLHPDKGLAYHFYGVSQWGAGVFPDKGINKWSLFVGDLPNVYQSQQVINNLTHSSNKTMTVGAATLLVVKVELIGTADKISLWVNPPTLRAADPGPPDVTVTTTKSAAFRAFTFSGGGGDDSMMETSLDEVRLGSSFGAVTP